jgi:XTP/dITP diphosphohydrolase
MPGPIFVTNNQGKHREVEKLLAGLDVRFQRLDLAAQDGDDVETRARARVLEAFSRLGEPCFCESTGLFLWEHQGAPGVKFKRMLRDLGEDEFAKTYGGSTGVAKVAVAYASSPTDVHVFSGSIAGKLLRSPRGTEGYGWDRLWVPDGYERTLSEMHGSTFIANMRAIPYLELGDHLRGDTSAGTFEAHITVAVCDLETFRAACTELGVKCISIELPDGANKSQPMTASFHHGELIAVEREVLEIARALAKKGFDVTRSKIERHGRLEKTTPETDDEARAAPSTNYFEYHVKIAPAADADIAVLAAKLAAVGGHLSRNARNTTGERFVTLRAKGVGRVTAEARFAALLALIEELRVPIRSRIREYTVKDSNLDLDRGWGP